MNEYQKDRVTRRIITCLHHSLSNKKIAVLGFAFKKDTGDTRESAAIDIVRGLVEENANVSIYDPKVDDENVWKEIDRSGSYNSRMRERVTICRTAYEACAAAHAVIIVTEWDEFNNKTPRDAITSPSLAATHLLGHTNGHSLKGSGSGTTDLLKSSFGAPNGNGSPSASWAPLDGEPASSSRPASPLPIRHSRDSSASWVGGEPSQLLRPKMDWAHVAKIMRKPMFVFDGRNIVDQAKLELLGFQVESVGKAGTVRKGPGDFD